LDGFSTLLYQIHHFDSIIETMLNHLLIQIHYQSPQYFHLLYSLPPLKNPSTTKPVATTFMVKAFIDDLGSLLEHVSMVLCHDKAHFFQPNLILPPFPKSAKSFF
jgi:hypothetical protein